jgi:hypothetical protein
MSSSFSQKQNMKKCFSSQTINSIYDTIRLDFESTRALIPDFFLTGVEPKGPRSFIYSGGMKLHQGTEK